MFSKSFIVIDSFVFSVFFLCLLCEKMNHLFYHIYLSSLATSHLVNNCGQALYFEPLHVVSQDCHLALYTVYMHDFFPLGLELSNTSQSSPQETVDEVSL